MNESLNQDALDHTVRECGLSRVHTKSIIETYLTAMGDASSRKNEEQAGDTCAPQASLCTTSPNQTLNQAAFNAAVDKISRGAGILEGEKMDYIEFLEAYISALPCEISVNGMALADIIKMQRMFKQCSGEANYPKWWQAVFDAGVKSVTDTWKCVEDNCIVRGPHKHLDKPKREIREEDVTDEILCSDISKIQENLRGYSPQTELHVWSRGLVHSLRARGYIIKRAIKDIEGGS